MNLYILYVITQNNEIYWVIIRDAAYTNYPWLIKPFPRRNLNACETNFNFYTFQYNNDNRAGIWTSESTMENLVKETGYTI